MIVETAVSAADKYYSVIITGEDIDRLVLLTALGSSKKNVYFQKRGKGNSPTMLYSSNSFKNKPQDILFLHAISGCDTTSAPFGIGKNKVMQMYSKNPSLSELLAIFKDPEATPNQIVDSGEKFLVKLYGGTIDVDNLEEMRYRIFSNVVAKSRCQLARLPPTKDATKYHLFRTYLQVQTWMGSQGSHQKLPSAWGWKLTKRGGYFYTLWNLRPIILIHCHMYLIIYCCHMYYINPIVCRLAITWISVISVVLLLNGDTMHYRVGLYTVTCTTLMLFTFVTIIFFTTLSYNSFE